MARPTLYDPPARGKRYLSPQANRNRIRGSDLDNVTLQAGEFITIWTDEVEADTAEFWGYGPQDREHADASFAFMELLASGAGTQTDGTQINGDVRFAIQDSTGDDVARREYRDLRDLADAKADARTERPLQAELQPAAGEDKTLALQVKVASAQDGAKVASDSNVKLHYGQVSGV